MAKGKFDITSVFNSQSQPEHSAGGFAIEMIPLSDIVPNEENFYSTEVIEPLANDILQNGLLHNIAVQRRGEDGKYKIISGERRYRAFLLLQEQGHAGYDAIPATVDAEENPLLEKYKLISANATARVLSDYEKMEQAKQIADIVRQLKQQGIDLPGRVREITADVLGVSVAQVGRLEKINRDLAPEAKEKFRAGEIGVTEAYEIAALQAEQQQQAVEQRAEKKAAPQKIIGVEHRKVPDNYDEGPAYPPIVPIETQTVRWAEGFDCELMRVAIWLETMNRIQPRKPEYDLIKSLILREAAMRRERAK